MTAVRWLAATLALACLLAAAVGEEAASEKGSATELFQDADNNHNGELSLSEFKLFVEESKAGEQRKLAGACATWHPRVLRAGK